MVKELGVEERHVYWSSVATSGWVDVEWKSRHSAPDRLPPGLRLTLKDIDKDSNAWVYRDDMGVMRVPSWVLEPWHR